MNPAMLVACTDAQVSTASGGLASAIGRLDELGLTAGMGEHFAAIHANLRTPLEWRGKRPDATADDVAADLISARRTRIDTRSLCKGEESMTAHHRREVTCGKG